MSSPPAAGERATRPTCWRSSTRSSGPSTSGSPSSPASTSPPGAELERLAACGGAAGATARHVRRVRRRLVDWTRHAGGSLQHRSEELAPDGLERLDRILEV